MCRGIAWKTSRSCAHVSSYTEGILEAFLIVWCLPWEGCSHLGSNFATDHPAGLFPVNRKPLQEIPSNCSLSISTDESWVCIFVLEEPVAVHLIEKTLISIFIVVGAFTNFFLQYLIKLVSASLDCEMNPSILQYRKTAWVVLDLMYLSWILWNIQTFIFCKYEAHVLCSRYFWITLKML